MTPEERREAQVRASGPWRPVGLTHYEALLAYFDKHEPPVADAIRYGLSRASLSGADGANSVALDSWFQGGRANTVDEDDIVLYGIDYPEGHPKRPA